MKLFFFVTAISLGTLLTKTVIAQNVTLNILAHNSGLIKKDSTIYLELSIHNMSSKDDVPAYKLKPKISAPSIVSISQAGHDLPVGWSIISNSGTEITLSNGIDKIPALKKRTILILLKAEAPGGPSTITGQLMFSNGVAPGKIPGAATFGDSTADNISTTTCKIIE